MLKFKNSLKRDYQKDPLKYGESPEYEDLYFLYIKCNLTLEEMEPYFNLKACTIMNRLKKAGIKKDWKLRTQAMERKMIEKYGVAKYSLLPECQEKIKKTCLEKYGVDHPLKSKEIRKQIEKTNLEKYGTKTPGENSRIKEKARKTCQERYGVNSYTQTEKFKQQSRETCLQRYGVEYGSQSKEFQEKVQQTNMKNFGVPYALMAEEIIQKSKKTCLEKWGTSNISTSHIDPQVLELINNKTKLQEYINKFEIKDFYHIAETLGITYDGLKKKLHEFDLWDKYDHKTSHAEIELRELFQDFKKTKRIIPPYEIDLFNEKLNLGIEYNGIYWHSELFKTNKYHQEKSKIALNKNIFLFHIFEHEWIDKRKKPILISMINNLINKNTDKIGARKCIIKNIDSKTCNKFLDENHLQGKDQSSIRYGLFYKETLVSVMTFCKPRFNKNYQYELSRFCNKINTTVIGAASKLFKHFLKEYNNPSIISYSNYSKTRGNLYKILGFKYKDLSAPNYIWFKGLNILSRYQCQKHLLENYKDFGNTEDEIMHNRGYLKCFDCGNIVWEYKG